MGRLARPKRHVSQWKWTWTGLRHLLRVLSITLGTCPGNKMLPTSLGHGPPYTSPSLTGTPVLSTDQQGLQRRPTCETSRRGQGRIKGHTARLLPYDRLVLRPQIGLNRSVVKKAILCLHTGPGESQEGMSALKRGSMALFLRASTFVLVTRLLL